MFIVQQTGFAIGICLLAMLCWGSWSNGQKLTTQAKVPVTLFYRDYVLGIALLTVVVVFTLGSIGRQGRPFVADVHQADWGALGLALTAGVVFNLGNQLLVAGIQSAGLAIAMPVGSGIALALGLVVNYLAEPKGSLWLLGAGAALVLVSIGCSAGAYTKKQKPDDQQQQNSHRGLVIAATAGVANGFFFWLVTSPLAPDFAHPAAGRLTPYTALALFVAGLLASNPLVELVLRRFADPPEAARVRYREVPAWQHTIGVGSGLVWGLGMGALLLASTEAGSAISFGLSQGATIVAVLWGVFAWREFQDAPAPAYRWLWAMGAAYVLGVGLIVAARLQP